GVALSVFIAVARALGHRQGWTGEISLIPWLLIMAAAMLVLGYLTAVGCRNLAAGTAARERDAAGRSMRGQVAGVARALVFVPAGSEIAEYERYRKELAVAAGQRPA
ncbi:MAG TPA: hypothetical protein VGD91_25085, partial [Trebonia sp.]